MKKISVVVPAYNAEAWIEECISSILQQSRSELEVLVVNNGSVDRTAKIVAQMAQKDARIRLFEQQNAGVSAGRNRGIDSAEGEYITFVDADDKIDSQMLEAMTECLEKEAADIAICDYIAWNGEKTEKRENSENSLKTVDKDTYVSEYLLRGYTRCWSVLYRRDVIGKVRFRENLTIGEDMMFLVDLLTNLKRICITDYKGYYYRSNPNGAMMRPFTPSYMDEIRAWKMADEIIGGEYPQQKARTASILAVSAILVAGKLARLSSGERRKYRTYTAECRKVVTEALKVPGARAELPGGYGIKTALFRICPEGYLNLYHIWKK